MNAREKVLSLLLAVLTPIMARGALPDGLVAAWSLSETSNESGAASRADLLGTYTLTDNNTTPSAAGHVYPNAADFNASESEFLSNNAFGFGGTVTVAAWVNFDSFPTNPVIVAKDADAATNKLDWNADILRFYVSGSQQGSVSVPFSNTNTNAWYFVIAWFDNTANTCSIQLDNGTVQTLGNITNTRQNTDAQFRIGARQLAGFEGYFDGKIGPVFIWNRVLSSGERMELYNNQSGFPLPWSVGFHSKRLHAPILKARIIR